jgi:enoyl-CoA hydratase
MTEPVLVRDQRDGILILRLNRPEARNALSPELIDDIGLSIEAAGDDHTVRCVVLTGTGDKAFCAGMDLRGFAEGSGPTTRDPHGLEAFMTFVKGEATVPVIGAANATAVAGGFELLMGCDLVVASDQAKFGIPEVKRGLFAAGGGVFIGTRIPMAVALEIALTGDLFGAARAVELGLINRAVAPEHVLDTAIELAEKIAANGPLAVAATKQLVRTAVTDAARAWELQSEWAAKVFSSDDAKEGATAFVERRSPNWTGR